MNAIDALVEAVLAAGTPVGWRDTVQNFGPQLMRNRSLGDAVLARASALEEEGRSADGQILRRWYDEVQRRIEEQRVMNALLQAGSEAEVDALLREHPFVATVDSVEQALAEVRRMTARKSPYPTHVAAAMAWPILNVNLRIAIFLGRADLRAGCLTERAVLAMRAGQPSSALRDFEAAASLWRSVEDLRETGRCLSMAGNALLGLGRRDEAVTVMLEAAQLLEGCRDHAMLGPTYEDVAQLLTVRGDTDGMLKCLSLSVHHRLAAGQVQKALPLLRTVLAMRLQQRDTERALPDADRIIALCAEHPGLLEPSEIAELVEMIRGVAVNTAVDSQSEAEFLRGRASGDASAHYRAFVDPQKLAAARRWQAVAERAESLSPSDQGEAVLRYVDSLLCLSAGQPERAVSQAEMALQSFDKRGDADGSLGVLTLLMQAEGARGHLTSAVARCDDALARLDSRHVGQRRARATCLIGRAGWLLALGRPQPALDDLHEALRLSRDEADVLARTNEAAAHSVQSRVYEFLGDFRAAVESRRESLRLARLIGHRRGEAMELLGLGTLIGKLVTGWLHLHLSPADADTLWQVAVQADHSLADPTADRSWHAIAVTLMERAAQIFEDIHDDVAWSEATLNLCNLLPATEASRQVAMLTDLATRKEAIGDRLGKAVALANLGAAHSALGQDEDAVHALEGSLAISRPSGYFESAAQAARDLADLHQRQGAADTAEAGYREAVKMIEAARTQVPLDDRARVGFSRNKGRAYTSLVDLLIDRGAHDEAFEMVQRAKSRALLELAATHGLQSTIQPRGRGAHLIEEEERCLARLHRAGAPEERPADSVADTLARLAAIYDELSGFDPEYVAMRRGTPATVSELRAWLTEQGRPVLLVEYFLSGSRLTLFFLRAEWPHVRVRQLTCTPEELSAACNDFQRQVVRYRNAAGSGWTRLADRLTAPLADHLRPGDLVYLVPHRRLHGLPLHALPATSQPLIVDHPVAFAPTSGLLPLAQNPAKGTGRLDSCASFGVVFEEEAREIAALFGAEPIGPVGLQADAVEQLCADKDVCHFSCHGFFNPVHPLSSGLILQGDAAAGVAPGALLTARRVMDMRLRSELICLSACESASSEIGEGDELLGLVRAFLHAGASSVVASLWAVDADSTRDLMLAFYRYLRANWERHGIIDKAGALRQAQLQVMDTIGARSSFYWAPFVLIGDWRGRKPAQRPSAPFAPS